MSSFIRSIYHDLMEKWWLNAANAPMSCFLEREVLRKTGINNSGGIFGSGKKITWVVSASEQILWLQMPPRKKHREACKFKRIHLNGFFCGTAFIQQGCHKHKTVTHAQFCFFHSLHPGWLTSRWKLGTEASHIADKKTGTWQGFGPRCSHKLQFSLVGKMGTETKRSSHSLTPYFFLSVASGETHKTRSKRGFSRARFCHFFFWYRTDGWGQNV